MTTAASIRIPLSTYSLQFNKSFTFRDAARIVPYLHAMGITDVYASSYLKAAPGSLHGYDVVDPTALNPEIGTHDDYREFVQALKAYGMGQILDVVPNHMSIAHSLNPWWRDVLENGPSASHATFFDIDWHPLKAELNNKVLLPILGDLYGLVLENQEITLAYEDGAFTVRYYDHALPVAPRSYLRILTHRLDHLVQFAGAHDSHIMELQSIITALRHLPGPNECGPERVLERNRENEIIKKRLSAVVRDSATVAKFIEENVQRFNGTKGEPRSFDLLDDLLNYQAYRLAYWRVASEEVNYRRFFDINDLIAIRMENPAVFHETHQLIFRLLEERAVTGLRIDHVDGLYDPEDYLQQVQAWARTELATNNETRGLPLYLIVEKILGSREPLPAQWPVHGTTGYDFLNLLNGLFVDRSNKQRFDTLYTRIIRNRVTFEDLVYEHKKLIMRVAMASEVNVLGHQLNQLSERDRRSRDFTLNSLIHAIREIMAYFPVYRTYMTPNVQEVMDRDRAYIRLAVTKAKRKNPALSGLVFDFVRDLLLERGNGHSHEDREERTRFVMKFQQTTSPVTAKGIEDTTFYNYHRLVSLNEVGGDPSQFGNPLSVFHDAMRERHERWPHSLSATSTHDTKRSEDVRARINVLSEMPLEWNARVTRWKKLNKKHVIEVDGQFAPDRNEEYLLYQTLIGVWPLSPLDDTQYQAFVDRMTAYMTKALHEAKVHTSWINPDHAYDEAVRNFTAAVLERDRPNPFLEDFIAWQRQLALYGMVNVLSQVLLKIAAPGIPDFYQGTELWDFSLVDPDNRRPVDYELRTGLLSELERTCGKMGSDSRTVVDSLLKTWTDGRIKMYVTTTALNFRRDRSEVFREGAYLPLDVYGSRKNHVVAFARCQNDRTAIAVTPRLVSQITPERHELPLGKDVWGDTSIGLPGHPRARLYRNVFTGETFAPNAGDFPRLSLGDILGILPVAFLEAVT